MHNKIKILIGFILFILTDIFIFFNIPVLQQIFGFCVYSILPGFLILLCFNIKTYRLGILKTIVYCVGLSISFLMIFGLLINFILPLLKILKPLSFYPILISFNILLLILFIISFFINRHTHDFPFSKAPLSLKDKIFIGISFLFPVWAIIGVKFLDFYKNDVISLSLLVGISLYVLIISLLNKDLSKRTLGFAIFMIALSLLFMVSLRSEHVFGCDVHGESFAFQLTQDAGKWVSQDYAYNSCLSVTILPVIYSAILGVGGEELFAFFFQIFFALVPLIVFLIISKYTSPILAFLSAFFFISIETFSFSMGLIRSEIAFLFFVLSILALLDKEINNVTEKIFGNESYEQKVKKLFFIIFLISIILSHYTTSYIYLGLLFSIVFINNIKKIEKGIIPVVSIITFILFFAIIFFWYGQIFSTPFSGLLNFIKDISTNLANPFIQELRTPSAISSISLPKGQGIILIGRIISLLMKVFIFIGLIYIIKNSKKLEIPKKFVTISIYLFIFVLLSIFLPLISKGINIERIFLLTLSILCFSGVIGAKFVFQKIGLAGYSEIFVAFLIIFFFLFQSGFVYSISNQPTSPGLDNDVLAYKMWHVYEQEIVAVKWVSEKKPMRVYADSDALLRIWNYGKIIPTYATSVEIQKGYVLGLNSELPNSYVFFRYDNAMNKNFLKKENEGYIYLNISSITGFERKNKVYDNGGSWLFR